MRKLWLLSLFLTHAATADTLRCGTKLVSVSDRTFEVIDKCGEPRDRHVISISSYWPTPITEQWVYGPRNGAYRLLTFEAGRLVRIELIRQ